MEGEELEMRFPPPAIVIALLCFSTCREGAARAEDAPQGPGEAARAGPGRPLQVRLRAEQLRNPYWYEEHGQGEEARQFWSQGYWERLLSAVAAEGYNAVLFMPEPWQ